MTQAHVTKRTRQEVIIMAKPKTYTKKDIAEKFGLELSYVPTWLRRAGIGRIPGQVDSENRALYSAEAVDNARAEMTGSGYWQETRVRKQISRSLGKDTTALGREQK